MCNALLWNDSHLLNALDGYNFLNIMNLTQRKLADLIYLIEISMSLVNPLLDRLFLDHDIIFLS